ncbi:hypothetical protein SSRV2_ORF11 [Saccharolobus shibatae rod virus 2]|nr:hypothetical protein SSRV2_ORF11 [Saccharolobus shibatae rod virus 2]
MHFIFFSLQYITFYLYKSFVVLQFLNMLINLRIKKKYKLTYCIFIPFSFSFSIMYLSSQHSLRSSS